MGHRTPEFLEIITRLEYDLRDFLKVPNYMDILILQGGATLQFSSIPLNLFGGSKNGKTSCSCADYFVTGYWSEKAYNEACIYSDRINKVVSTYGSIPTENEWSFSLNGIDKTVAYCHYTSNETIQGLEFQQAPALPLNNNYQVDVPLIADMSSNIGTRNIDWSKHSIVYGSVHKNLGPAGICLVFGDRKYMDGSRELKYCPSYCSWLKQLEAKSMYSTPSTFSIYAAGCYLKYTKSKGGLSY